MQQILFSLNAILTDSLHHTAVKPFNGQYTTSYSLKSWANDVYSINVEYHKQNGLKKGIDRIEMSSPWMLLILLFGFLSIAFSRSAYQKRFNMLFQTLFNWKLSKQIIRYEKVYTHPVNLLLTINFTLCVPLFFGIIRSWHLNELDSLGFSFALVLIPLLIYLILKLAIYKFSGWLFLEKEAIEEYIFQTNLFNKYLGVFYLILTSLLIYSPVPFGILYTIGTSTLFLFVLFQIVRGFLIGIQSGNNLFFIILYLCTLEILPWLIMGKWIKNTL